MFQPNHTPAHKGKVITTQPIRGEHLQSIRQLLQDRPRDLALWSVGCNCALRIGDLLSLRWDELEDDGQRISFRVKERKTGNLRLLVLNQRASEDLRRWRALSDSEWCFSGQRGRLTTATAGRMVKQWAKDVGVRSQVSSHSLRKSWVRAQLDVFKTPLYVCMQALGHHSELQTLTYAGCIRDGVAAAYDNAI